MPADAAPRPSLAPSSLAHRFLLPGVLAQIGQMLQAHPDLHLRIEGHTDSQGAESANRHLSQRRAEAVMQILIGEYGIDAARLKAVGRGEGEPAASNDTADDRQQNRRVELVRL